MATVADKETLDGSANVVSWRLDEQPAELRFVFFLSSLLFPVAYPGGSFTDISSPRGRRGDLPKFNVSFHYLLLTVVLKDVASPIPAFHFGQST